MGVGCANEEARTARSHHNRRLGVEGRDHCPAGGGSRRCHTALRSGSNHLYSIHTRARALSTVKRAHVSTALKRRLRNDRLLEAVKKAYIRITGVWAQPRRVSWPPAWHPPRCSGPYFSALTCAGATPACARPTPCSMPCRACPPRW